MQRFYLVNSRTIFAFRMNLNKESIEKDARSSAVSSRVGYDN
jgi:hypothetical protein